jgi:hypothetical protein
MTVMAEEETGTTPLDDGMGAEEQTDLEEPTQAVPDDQGDAADPLLDKTGAGPEDPTDPNYKYWQAAYTQTRQRERAQYGKVEAEHKQFGEVLRNFYQDDGYALQVLRQRFPQLAHQLSLGPQGMPQSIPQNTLQAQPVNPTVQLLEQSLGEDLAFLAPRLGPVLEQVIQAGIKAGLAPIEQQTQQQQAAARKSTEDALLAEMDSAHPGWEARYGKDMQELDAFLNSDALSHPKFGNKYQLLLKLVNPDLTRVDAVRSLGNAARSRLTTGRTGRQSQPDPTESILKARTNSDAFRLAAEAAMREMGTSA